jgi:hypothetical protein
MGPGLKRILVAAHDLPLRTTRIALLKQAGYEVESGATDDDAMAILEIERFDSVLIGRKSLLPKKGIDQRLREKYPDLLTLKIAGVEAEHSIICTFSVLGQD